MLDALLKQEQKANAANPLGLQRQAMHQCSFSKCKHGQNPALCTVKHPLAAAGGVVVLAEQFSHDIYRKSLARLFEVDEHGHLQMYFNATFDVIVSKVRIYWLSLQAMLPGLHC